MENNKREYIERLQMVISHLHGCDYVWLETVPVHETFRGETVWDGEVEVFTVNHPQARKAYAWSTAEGKFTAVLQIPPATDPQNAVRVSIVADAKHPRGCKHDWLPNGTCLKCGAKKGASRNPS